MSDGQSGAYWHTGWSYDRYSSYVTYVRKKKLTFSNHCIASDYEEKIKIEKYIMFSLPKIFKLEVEISPHRNLFSFKHFYFLKNFLYKIQSSHFNLQAFVQFFEDNSENLNDSAKLLRNEFILNSNSFPKGLL